MIARNIAPGTGRTFTAETWDFIPDEIWKSARAEAFKKMDPHAEVRIYASDIDSKAIVAAEENAAEAGVGDCILFERKAFRDLNTGESGDRRGSEEPDVQGSPAVPNESGDPDKPNVPGEHGIIICNPPYGERIGERAELEKIYQEIGIFFSQNPTWSLYLITTDKSFEASAFRRPADRRRKLYNGRLETTFYQYYGEKPAKAEVTSAAHE
jgi:putative N6-adenine-specific DNA methylase